jgi:hypothetical protein
MQSCYQIGHSAPWSHDIIGSLSERREVHLNAST